MVGCISRLPNVSYSFTHTFSHSLSLSPSLPLSPSSLRCTCSSSKTAPGPVGEVTVRLWLSREFSGFLRAFSQSVASRDSFSRTRCVLHSSCFTPSAISSSTTEPLISFLLSFFLFIYFSVPCLHCRKHRDLMLCGSDVFHASRNTTGINRAPICRYAWSTCMYIRRQRWYFANRLNALLNNADAWQTLCPTNAIIATQYYYISGANVLWC